MTTSLLPVPKARFFTASGEPLAGGFVHTYVGGTVNTPKASYTDSTGGTSNSNPVELDANGEANIWLDGNYKIVLEDSDNVEQWSVDNISSVYISPAMAPVTGASTLAAARTAMGVPGLSGTNTFTGTLTMSGAAINLADFVTIPSATSIDLGAAASNSIFLSGTTAVTAFGTITAGVERLVILTGTVPLTYNATSLKLPGLASITGASGDSFEAVSLGSGNWQVVRYQRANGDPVMVQPKFSVNRAGSNQASIGAGVYTKIQFNNEVYDTNNNFDPATNYRFLPTVAGKYKFSLAATLTAIGADKSTYVAIYKNGTIANQAGASSSGAVANPGFISCDIDMNGSTDYVEAFVFNGDSSPQTLDGINTNTWFMGARLP